MRASVHHHITRASHERMPCPHARQRSVSHIGQELSIVACLPTRTLTWYADSGCPEFTKSRSYSGGVLNTPSACPRLALTGMPVPRRASLGGCCSPLPRVPPAVPDAPWRYGQFWQVLHSSPWCHPQLVHWPPALPHQPLSSVWEVVVECVLRRVSVVRPCHSTRQPQHHVLMA